MRESIYNQLIFVIGVAFGSISYMVTKDIVYALSIAFISGIASFAGKEFAKYIYEKFKIKEDV